jgi:hypothetical protein
MLLTYPEYERDKLLLSLNIFLKVNLDNLTQENFVWKERGGGGER